MVLWRHKKHRSFRRSSAALLIAGLLLAQFGFAPGATAAAARKHDTRPPLIWIRAGDHKGLTRVLVSWHSPVDYKVEDAPGMVTVTFDHPARPDLGDTAKQTFRDVQSIAADSDPQHLTVHIAVKPGSHPRAFKAGNMVIVDILDSTDPAPAVPAEQTATATAPPVQKSDLPATGETVIHLVPAEAVSLAAFRRGPYLWIAADGKLPASAPAVSGLEALAEPTHYVAQSGNLLRYRIRDEDRITTRQHGMGWDIVLSEKAAGDKGLAISGSVASDSIRINAPGAVKVLTLADPEMGDTLNVVPLPGAASHVSQAHHFADGDVLESAQGVVAVLRKAASDVTAGNGAVAIKGLDLSADFDAGAAKTAPLFDLVAWRAGGLPELVKRRKEIEHASLADDGSNNEKTAIELARLYVANGLGNEAIAACRMALDQEPDLVKSPDFFALRGAAYALAGRMPEAIADFDVEALRDQPEAALWKAYAESGGTAEQKQEAFSTMESDIDTIGKYPLEVRQRFTLALAALAVEKRDLSGMQAAASLLKNDPPSVAMAPALLSLKAGIASASNKPDVAAKDYAAVARSGDDYWRALAEFASVGDGLEHNTLPAKDAIAKLESLRYQWRGDDLELKTLRQLGNLYVGEHDYKDALAVLTQLRDLAPDTPYAIAAKDNMIEGAKHAFTPDASATLPPLEALDLYGSLKDQLPAHTVPDSDVRNLSDRLAAIGVMDKAAALLDPQVKEATDPVAKAQLGARIAALRLLDDHPDLALASLTASAPAGSAKLPDQLQTDRKLLQARALSKSGKPDEAMTALQGISSREADALRVEIAWGQHDWPVSAAALNRLAGSAPADGKMTPEQATIVLNEAVALSLAQDQPGLEKIRNAFIGPMSKTDKASAFTLLTSASTDMAAPSVDAVKASVSNLDIFDNFLSSYRKGPGKA